MLKEKMEASKDALPWQNYSTVDLGREARNNLAHEGILLDKENCFTYINAIEIELKAWGII